MKTSYKIAIVGSTGLVGRTVLKILEEKDFKRHKDAVAYFNQNYVATGLFDREIGKKLGRLKRKREASDYDDFYVASYDEANEQYKAAESIIDAIQSFLNRK